MDQVDFVMCATPSSCLILINCSLGDCITTKHSLRDKVMMTSFVTQA